MKERRSGGKPDEGSGSWGTEALPLSVRRELLNRDLHKLGFREVGAGGTEPATEALPEEMDVAQRQGERPKAADDGELHRR